MHTTLIRKQILTSGRLLARDVDLCHAATHEKSECTRNRSKFRATLRERGPETPVEGNIDSRLNETTRPRPDRNIFVRFI